MISVLMPVRNGAQTLETAFESLFAQNSRHGLEIVAVDDGSTDSTPGLLNAWKSRWPALRVVTTPGLGIAKALNLGLSFCNHDWIARMDADDRCHPERLEKQLELALSNEKIALVGCPVKHWTMASDPRNFDGMAKHIAWANSKTTHEEMAQALWIDSPLPHPSWLVKRKAFETVGFYSEKANVPEDYEWLLRFFLAAEKNGMRAAKTTGPALLDWADHATRLTRSNPAYSEEAFHQVKAAALKRLFDGERPLFVFGLGSKAKSFFPFLLDAGVNISAFVDVNPRRQGEPYRGVPVLTIDEWRAHKEEGHPFVLAVLGTAEAREACEKFCLDEGLKPFSSFLAV